MAVVCSTITIRRLPCLAKTLSFLTFFAVQDLNFEFSREKKQVKERILSEKSKKSPDSAWQ